MIAVSSIRPHSMSSEYAANQAAAHESWEKVFERIWYYGNPADGPCGAKTSYVPTENNYYPTIKQMAKLCALQKDWCALVNADIVIGSNILGVEKELKARNAKAAISRRFEFIPPAHPVSGELVDLGLDFFAAQPRMWDFVWREIPEQYRIGHIMFDTWLMAFFSRWCGRDAYDVTPQKFVFHPRHGDRKTVHNIDTTPDTTLSHISWPPGRLRCCVDYKGYSANSVP